MEVSTATIIAAAAAQRISSFLEKRLTCFVRGDWIPVVPKPDYRESHCQIHFGYPG